MSYYKSLLASIQHAQYMCDARADEYSKRLAVYKNKLHKTESVQTYQKNDSRRKELGLNLNLYFKHQVQEREPQIQGLRDTIEYYKSVIEEASRAAKAFPGIVALIQGQTYDNFDFNQAIFAINLVIDLIKQKLEMYNKKQASYKTIIENASNADVNTPSANINAIQILVKRNDAITKKYVQNLLNMGVVMDIVLRYKNLTENRLNIQNAAYDAVAAVR